MIHSVLVAVDGSDGSRRAAALAGNLAHHLTARVCLLHVVEPIPDVYSQALGLPVLEYNQRRLAHGQRLLDELCDELSLPGAEKVLQVGSAPETICAEAEERAVDMVLLGAHGHGHPRRFMTGSVATRVCGLCTRNVTIVQ